MAVLQLTSLLIDALVAKLADGIGARVAEINAFYADSLQIAEPDRSDIYRFGQSEFPRTPAFIVTEAADGADVTEEGPHSLSLEDHLVVAIVDQDVDRATLGTRLLRLRSAVVATVWDDDPKERLPNPSGGIDAAYSIKVEGWRPGRALEIVEEDSGTSVYRSMDIVLFRALRAEE